MTEQRNAKPRLRSRLWFDNPDNPGMTALYLERYLNYGLTRRELTSGRPIIAIAQTGSDLSPCNRHHIELAKRVREGIRDAGGVAFEFPVHPIQETGKRPTAALDRNLAYLGLVELLYGYPIDGVVLTTGCDKTTPACLMAAATVNIPAIVLSGGPMLNGWRDGERIGSGTVVWKAREEQAAGRIDYREFIDIVAASAPSVGHCNTMGTASTMNALAEALGMSLPGCAAIPAPYRERAQIAYKTGRRAVEIVHEDLKPSDILTRKAFENAIVACSAIGGSTNAPIHINAIARHVGVALTIDDWEEIGYAVPLLVNMQPAGTYLGEEYYRAGGLPAVMRELAGAGRVHGDALTINGRTMGENVAGAAAQDPDVILPYTKPMKQAAGFKVLRGNLFDSAIMKTSVISEEFRRRYLSNPADPEAFEGRAVVFEGPEDYHRRIDDAALGIDESTILVIRGVGPVGYPGSAEVVNMQPPAALNQAGHQLAALHRRRQTIRHIGVAVDPQCIPRSRRGRRPRGVAHRRPYPDRPQGRHRRHPDFGGRAGAAPRGSGGGRRLQISAEPDAVAGDPARHGRPARRRHGAQAGGQIPARRAEIRSPRQSLRRRLWAANP
jgi:dihydroxy-acid dehydratase